MTYVNVLEDYPNVGGDYPGYKYGPYYYRNSGGGDGFHRENDYTCSITIKKDSLCYWRQGTFPPKTKGTIAYATQTYTFADGEAAAINKLYELLKGHDLQLNVTIAESRKALQSITQRLHSLGKSLQLARKGRFKKAIEYLLSNGLGRRSRDGYNFTKQSLAQNWLEYYYALSPLLSDIENAVKAYDNRYGVVRGNYSVGVSHTGVPTIFSQHEWAEKTGIKSWRLEVKLASGYRLTTADYLGLTNWALPAWELIPGSFIVDWVLPIGGWVEAVHAVHSISTEEVISTVFTRTRCSGLSGKPPFTIIPYGDNERETYQVSRNVTPQIAIPKLGFKTLNETLGYEKINVVNALALIASKR